MSAAGGERRAFAPACVGNIGAGFDLLGHSIEGPRDVARVRRIRRPEVRLRAIRGDAPGAGDLPLEPWRNTAGRALAILRRGLGLGHGFEIELDKGIALGSGLGGSAASCVAALVAANALLDRPLPAADLYRLALRGEAAASGTRHGDNVAPMLLGGVALATRGRMVALPAPAWLHCAVVRPDLVIETRRARALLEAPYPLRQVVAQTSCLALFLVGLERGDPELIREGLRDLLVEPRRADLIPGFYEVQAAALDHGALGASISGAGPSVFGWFRSRSEAEAAAPAMQAAFRAAGLGSRAHVSPVAGPRASLLPAASSPEEAAGEAAP
ncbi:MAG: homoserine kinase [Thermoanaerobaculia bacterium]